MNMQTESIYRSLMKVSHLPKMPITLIPIEKGKELNGEQAVVIGELSLLGERGFLCSTVSLLTSDESGVRGWSLSLGDPEHPDEELYFFDTTRRSHRGTELPSGMIYFQMVVPREFAEENADRRAIEEVVAYVLPHISDEGPPPPHPEEI